MADLEPGVIKNESGRVDKSSGRLGDGGTHRSTSPSKT